MTEVQESVSESVKTEDEQRTVVRTQQVKKIYTMGEIEVHALRGVDMEIYTDTGSLLVTWRVKQSKNRFYVIDLIVADISLVVTKRDEFNSLLKNVDYNLKEFNILLKNQNEESYNKVIN